MKRIISAILTIIGLTGVSSAATVTAEFIPEAATPTPYDWSNASRWKIGGAYGGVLPSASDAVWLTSSYLRSNPLYLSAGTVGRSSTLYLSNFSKTTTTPIELIIDGGAMLVSGTANLGYKSAGFLTLQNGGVMTNENRVIVGVELSDDNITAGYLKKYNACVNVADKDSSMTLKGALLIGNQREGVSVVENHGTINLLGTATGYREIFLGSNDVARTSGTVVSVLDNYGTIAATVNHRYFIGGTAGQEGHVTNHVGATIDKAYVITVGACTNATGTLVNDGTINTARFYVGGDTFNSLSGGKNSTTPTVGIVTNSGTIYATSLTRIGYAPYATGVFDNTGDLTTGNEIIIGYEANSTGIVRHAAGTIRQTNAEKPFYIGYLGDGTLELSGQTRTDMTSENFQISSGKNSHGTLIMRDQAVLDFGGNQLKAAVDTQSAAANVSIGDEAQVLNIGEFRFGSRYKDSTIEVKDHATIANIADFRMCDNRSTEVTGTSTFRISGNACVTNVAHVRLGTNKYNKIVFEIADNGYFALPDEATNSNNIEMSNQGNQLGEGLIRLRGGRIGLGNQGGLWLGSNTKAYAPGCPARLQGYGSITNQGHGTIWSGIAIRSGSVTADGEGVARDLDMKTFGVIQGSETSDRTYLNSSGTNGWYAINKGRLLYPMRDCETTSSTFGDYGRLTNDVPKFVNSAQFLFRNASGAKITTKRRYIAELYASDRTDIPEGLRADSDVGLRVRRLGIWRAGVNKNMNATASSRIDFATAEMKVRYNNWPMEELKDSEGNLPPDLRIGLFAHDGSASGKWRCLKSVPASAAADSHYLIEGTVGESDGLYNIGWFAVVAYEPNGMSVIVK